MFAILIILGKHQNGGNVDEDNLDDTTPYADFSVPDLFNHVSNNNGYPRQYHQSKLGKNNLINTINFIYMTTNSSFFGMPLYKIMEISWAISGTMSGTNSGAISGTIFWTISGTISGTIYESILGTIL